MIKLKIVTVDIYTYIAYSDPYGARALISSHGYALADDSDDPESLAQQLTELVADNGEPALIKLLKMHPDRDAILEYCADQESAGGKDEKKGCGCDKCKEKLLENYIKPNNDNQSHSIMSLHQGNIFLIAAALILGVAVIASSNKN